MKSTKINGVEMSLSEAEAEELMNRKPADRTHDEDIRLAMKEVLANPEVQKAMKKLAEI